MAVSVIIQATTSITAMTNAGHGPDPEVAISSIDYEINCLVAPGLAEDATDLILATAIINQVSMSQNRSFDDTR